MGKVTQPTDRRVKHGAHGHPLYQTWTGMLARCENPQHEAYPRYGGRGITVCGQWHDLALFIADIERDLGSRPEGCTLDRWPDNDGNYEPGNVRWATKSEQAKNRRADLGRSERVRSQWEQRPARAEACEYCGNEYETRAAAGSAYLKFCSKGCKAAARRASGVDDVEHACHQCGGTFTANRYDKVRHCSKACAATCQHHGGCPR